MNVFFLNSFIHWFRCDDNTEDRYWGRGDKEEDAQKRVVKRRNKLLNHVLQTHQDYIHNFISFHFFHTYKFLPYIIFKMKQKTIYNTGLKRNQVDWKRKAAHPQSNNKNRFRNNKKSKHSVDLHSKGWKRIT